MIRVLDDWLLLPERFAVHERSRTAVIADLHLGYGAARRRQGDAIPIPSLRDELRPFLDAVRLHDLRDVIIAGDLFERGYDRDIAQSLLEMLHELHVNLAGLIPGNHDRGIEKNELGLPIRREGVLLDGWQIVHGDEPIGAEKTVMGHWHPAVRLGRRKAPCFVVNDHQLILPAFSRDAAGVILGDEHRWCGSMTFPISAGKVLDQQKCAIRGK